MNLMKTLLGCITSKSISDIFAFWKESTLNYILFCRQLNQLALAKAQEFYEITLQKSAAGSGQTHASVQEKVNTLLVDLRLYEKGLKVNNCNIERE